MDTKKTKIILIIGLLAFALCVQVVTAVAVSASTDNSNRYVVPVDSTYLGKTYSDWSVQWWQWVLAIPNDKNQNPLYDDGTGINTINAESGDVWFLAGSWIGTKKLTINVPAGKALFLPIINVEGSKIEGLGNTETEMRAYSTGIIDNVTEKVAKIDGEMVNLDNYRVASKLFVFTLPANNNVLGIPVPPYSSPSVSDGYWIMVKPLSLGTHTIYIYGKAIHIPPTNSTFVTEMTYHIKVVPN